MDDDTFLSWKGNMKDDEDNDATIVLNDDKTSIKEFQFRIDLRKSSNITEVLQAILNLCKSIILY